MKLLARDQPGDRIGKNYGENRNRDMPDISSLTDQDLQQVKEYLIGLGKTLQKKKGIGNRGAMLSEEETVLNGLLHPQRGDILISILRLGQDLNIFVQNPRDPDNPFVVMNPRDHGKNPGRRKLNTSDSQLQEGEFALFLSTAQDRELFRISKDQFINLYSIELEIAENRPEASDREQDLRRKHLSECTEDERWKIYKANWDFDSRRKIIIEDMMTIPVLYAKYKQPVKQQNLSLEPGIFESSLHQMIRDIYPSNLRPVLKKDFPREHDEKIKEVMDCLKSVRIKIQEKINGSQTPEFIDYLKEYDAHIEEIITRDPHLTRI